jgi:hypothetical protein
MSSDLFYSRLHIRIVKKEMTSGMALSFTYDKGPSR